MAKAIYFDMDGTIANLYGVPNWLDLLRTYDASPYQNAIPMVNMNLLARYLNKVQKQGYTIGIVSWLSKEPTSDYDKAVIEAKMRWLKIHLKSVEFNEIHIVAHGTPKSSVVAVKGGLLFDDEINNRKEWCASASGAVACDVENILDVLKGLVNEP